MEHLRTTFGDETFQWVDVQRAMVIDAITGEPSKLENGRLIGTMEDALGLLRRIRGWETRLVLVKLDAVAAFVIPDSPAPVSAERTSNG